MQAYRVEEYGPWCADNREIGANRLLSSSYTERPIPPSEFTEFLNRVPEWQPRYWKDAPAEYVQLVNSNGYKETENLQTLSESEFPHVVRQSFQGWKNYFKEGPAINESSPSFKQVKKFLQKNPLYARNYWKNIQDIEDKEVAGKHYLESFLNKNLDPDALVPDEELAPFLKVALYNAEQAEKSTEK